MLRQFAKRFSALLLVAALAVVPLHAIPRPHRGGNARDQILALEQQWRQAQLAVDVAGMEKLLSENYIGITVSGQVVTKSQQLDRMRSQELQITRFEMSDTKIKLIGNGQVAIVNSLAQVEGKAEGRSINGSFRYTRVYQKVSGGLWKITSFEATRVPNGLSPSSTEP
jgi:ketosteroid isomerase-like protein